jgi:CDP-glucose 4,6-dehydratase
MEDLVNLNKDFWKNKKVLITGHTGFKGSWLSIILKELGCKVYGYSLEPNRSQKLFKLFDIQNTIDKSVFGNICEYKRLKNFCLSIKPNIIINLAAQSLVIDGYKDPLSNFRSNILGAINILDISDNIKSTKFFLNVTTDKVYLTENKLKLLNEDSKLFAHDPYGISKVCSDLLTQSYNHFNKNKNLKFIVARSGNVIGGGDFTKNRIIPDILRSINQKKNLILRNPSHIRPWQHVFEPLTGYIILIEKFYSTKSFDKNNDIAWNFGPNIRSCITVDKLTRKFLKFQKFNISKLNKFSNLKETKFLGINSSKSKNKLLWKQKWDIDKTIKSIYDWNDFYKNKEGNIKKYSLKQYIEYLQD